MKATQTERLIAWLRQSPGSSSIEITLGLRIVNVTGRISDIRKLPGLDVECKTVDGVATGHKPEDWRDLGPSQPLPPKGYSGSMVTAAPGWRETKHLRRDEDNAARREQRAKAKTA